VLFKPFLSRSERLPVDIIVSLSLGIAKKVS
jgi:hypothetical protein